MVPSHMVMLRWLASLAALTATMPAARVGPAPWSVSQATSFSLSGVQSVAAHAAATPDGHMYVVVGPQARPPQHQYGDVSAGSVWLEGLDAIGGTSSAQIGGVLGVAAITTDAAAYVYLAGPAAVSGLPTTAGGSGPTYICKLQSDLVLVSCRYIDANFRITGITLDSAGNIYCSGMRTASSLPAPTTAGALAIGNRQVVVLKLAALTLL